MQVMAAQYEGLVGKVLDSVWEPNDRRLVSHMRNTLHACQWLTLSAHARTRSGNWCKLKPEYLEGKWDADAAIIAGW